MTKTLTYYNEFATQYSQNTLDIEFEMKRNMLLQYLEAGAHILDLGCGSGRDSKAFLEKGYVVSAIDGSIELCKLASETIGQVVVCKMFNQLDEKELYDAVWACASLLHLSSTELQDVFPKVIAAIKPGGYFYASFKYGNFEGEREGRYFTDFTEKTFSTFIASFKDLSIIDSQVSVDMMPGRENLKWLNIVMKKID